MSRTSKISHKAKASKQSKGSTAGRDDAKKSPVPSKQPKASWMASKSDKGKGRNKVTK
jgi:hypothetical protein